MQLKVWADSEYATSQFKFEFKMPDVLNEEEFLTMLRACASALMRLQAKHEEGA